MMNIQDIPIERVFRNTWLSDRRHATITEVTVIGYMEKVRARSRSSSQKFYSCLALVGFKDGADTEYIIAPIGKAGRKDTWGGTDMECGDRFNQPSPQYQFFRTLPSVEEVLEFARRVGFYDVFESEQVAESIGPVLDRFCVK